MIRSRATCNIRTWSSSAATWNEQVNSGPRSSATLEQFQPLLEQDGTMEMENEG